MCHLLEVTHHRQHRQHRLNRHPIRPFSSLAYFEVGRIGATVVETAMKVVVRQYDHLILKTLHQMPECRAIIDVGRGGAPGTDQALAVEQNAQFSTDNPAEIAEGFPADLFGTATGAARVEEFHAKAVNHAEECGGGHESLCPLVMGCQQTEQPGSFG